MFLRSRFIAAAFASFLCGLLFAESPSAADSLVQLLIQKKVLSPAEAARIQAAPAEARPAALATLLESKGILTAAEVSSIAPPVTEPASVPAAPKAAPVVSAARRLPSSDDEQKRVTFYGAVLWNAFTDTSLTNIQDLPTVNAKQGSDLFPNDKSFGMTVRQSRLGLRFSGGEVHGAKLGGQLEMDFFGGKTPLANGINMDVIRLRIAAARMDWKNVSVIGGQDWSVFAPLNPLSFATYAIPAMSAAGNPWIRTPQVRIEMRKAVGNDSKLQWQFAATDPDMGDYQTAQFLASRTPAIGERGRFPGFDNRLSLATSVLGHGATFGLSSHYGRGKNTGLTGAIPVVRPVDSWGVAADYILPLHAKFLITGEAYEGRALGMYSVASGVSILPVGTGGEHGVLSRGGWAQAQWVPARRWQINLGYGVDVADQRNLRTGDKSKNQNYMGNLFYKVSPQVTVALEWRRLLTNWLNQALLGETGNQANVAFIYQF